MQTQLPDYLEQAMVLAKRMERDGLSQEQLARKIGKSQSAVANKLRLLKHPPAVLQALSRHGLTERHARALLRLPAERRLAAEGEIAARAMTVAETEQYIDRLLEPESGILHTVTRRLEQLRASGIPCRWENAGRELVVRISLE